MDQTLVLEEAENRLLLGFGCEFRGASRCTRLGIWQTLFTTKLRIPDNAGEEDERNTEADTCDAKQALDMFIGINSGITFGRTGRIGENLDQWASKP